MGYWSDKRVVVTGGAGFLGSFVVDELNRLGPLAVFVPRSAEYDLREKDAIDRMLRDARPDVVIHLAATVGGIGANRRNPGRFFYDNAVMGIQLIEMARRPAWRSSSPSAPSAPTPSSRPSPSRRTTSGAATRRRPTPPTAWPRRCCWCRARPTGSSTASPASTCCPSTSTARGDNFDPATSPRHPGPHPQVRGGPRGGRRVHHAWGSGKPTREFLYVEDAARGILLAAEKYDKPEPVNLGSGAEISIRDLVELIARLVGYQGEVRWDADQPDGQPRRMLDTTRARQEFGFAAQVGFEEGLRRTVEWYKANRAG